MAKDQNPTATRQAILDAAFNLFYHNGFQATGLSEIVERAGVSKGAIYNHFASKLELGYAIVDEVLHEYVLSHWMAAYQEREDPIEATLAVMEKARGFIAESEFNLGCPLNNLVQEMASIDEGFRSRLNQLTENWVKAVSASFKRAQERGYLKSDFNPDEIAGFVVTVFEGTMGLVKCARSAEYLEQNTRQLLAYLNPLRQGPLPKGDSQTKLSATATTPRHTLKPSVSKQSPLKPSISKQDPLKQNTLKQSCPGIASASPNVTLEGKRK